MPDNLFDSNPLARPFFLERGYANDFVHDARGIVGRVRQNGDVVNEFGARLGRVDQTRTTFTEASSTPVTWSLPRLGALDARPGLGGLGGIQPPRLF